MALEPGTYKAKLIDYGISETKKGDPSILLKFITETGDEISHFLYLTPKAQPYTTKNLMVFGYKGQALERIADGPDGGLLDTDKDIELVLENEDYNDKTYLRVKWINEIGGGGFKKLAKAEATTKLKGVDLSAHVKEIQQELGTTDENPF